MAQICYFGFLLICIAINHGGFRDDHGLSFYGEHLQTLIPYSLGTIGCSLFILRAAALLHGTGELYRVLRLGLRAMAALLFLLLITPDTLGTFLNWSHIVAAFVLFLGELVLAIWLAFMKNKDVILRSLAAVQLAGGLAAMFSEIGSLQYLSGSSLVFQLSFCVLLVRAIALLPENGREEPPLPASDRPAAV